MTNEEFNNKYINYLEKGHYGCDITDPKCIAYLDNKFQELIKIPYFSYSQIKWKFNRARFYCRPKTINTHEIEEELNKIDKERGL